MKLLLVIFAFGLSGCSYGFLTPEVIKELKDDKASVCANLQGGPGGIPYGSARFCRANSDNHSKLEIKPDGSIVVDHNVSK